MATTVLEVYKDALNQEIVEGKCCVFNTDRQLRFGVVVESRVKVKVASASAWVGSGKVWEQWVYPQEVVMIEEDWLFSKLDAETLYKMATIKSDVDEQVAKVVARKERKKAKLAAQRT